MKPETCNIKHKKTPKQNIKEMFHVSCFMFQERGITIYIALLVMSGALAIALSVSTIFIGEFTITRDTTNSLKAIYVADSAMEYTLYQTRPQATYDNTSLQLTLSSGGTVSLLGSTTILSSTNCASVIGINGVVCSAEAKLVAKGTVDGCSASTGATDCTQVIARGSFGNVNRAMEIVYPNL